jgi:hypothetical protein
MICQIAFEKYEVSKNLPCDHFFHKVPSTVYPTHTALTLHSHCTHTALILHSHCTHTALILHSHCTHTALMLHSYCTHAALILHSYCTHTALILHSHCTHTALILHSYCIHTALILHSYCTHTFPGQVFCKFCIDKWLIKNATGNSAVPPECPACKKSVACYLPVCKQHKIEVANKRWNLLFMVLIMTWSLLLLSVAFCFVIKVLHVEYYVLMYCTHCTALIVLHSVLHPILYTHSPYNPLPLYCTLSCTLTLPTIRFIIIASSSV